MKCFNCNKEIPNESDFCSFCGNKIKEEKEVRDVKKETNKKKKILLIIGMILVIVFVITIVVFYNNKNKELKSIDDISKEIIERTCIKNEIGLFKDDNILEEKYNDKNDLIYCKYKLNNEIKENNYNYLYDDKDRVTNITYTDEDNHKSTLDIEYNEEEIYKVTANYDISKTEYYYMYTEDKKIITKYQTSNQTLGNRIAGDTKYVGAYAIYEKEINGKNYNLIVEIDENNTIKRKDIYEINNSKADNSFSEFGLFPQSYASDSINILKCPNLITKYVGVGNINVPIINTDNKIYTSSITTSRIENSIKYIYDEEGRIIFWGSEEIDTNKFYSIYEENADKTCWKYNLADGGTSYQALGLKKQYCVSKTKLYYNDNNEIYKYEDYETEYITEQEFKTKEKEYLSYIEENKIDSDSIINAFNDVLNKNDFYLDIEENIEESEEESNSQSATEYTIDNNSSNKNSSNNSNNNSNYSEKTITTINYISSIGTNERDFVHSTLNGEFFIDGTIDFTTNGDWYEEAKKISVTVNGQSIKTRISEGTLVFEGIVNLTEGKQTITIIANNPNGENKKESFTITNTPKDYEIPEFRR